MDDAADKKRSTSCINTHVSALILSSASERSVTPAGEIPVRRRHLDSPPSPVDHGNPINPAITVSLALSDHHEEEKLNARFNQDEQAISQQPAPLFQDFDDLLPGTDTDTDLDRSPSQTGTPSEDYAVPDSITYSLRLAFDGQEVPNPYKDIPIQFNPSSNYDDISRKSYDFVETIFASTTLQGRSLNFRYGDCTITCGHSDISKHTQGLSTEADWRDICTVVTNLWSSSGRMNIHLDIYRNYFGLLTKRITDESFASAKRTEIHNLMQIAFDGREYISRTDLTRVASVDMIREIIIEDPTIESTQKENFILEVEKKARNLLTLCVYAQLSMQCLHALLHNRGLTDKTYPIIEKQHLCHKKCGPNFRNLVKAQGGFHAAVFDKPGQHQRLHKGIVVPLHYQPRKELSDTHSNDKPVARSEQEVLHGGGAEIQSPGKGLDSRLDSSRITMSEQEAEEEEEEEDNPEKKAAHCGSGAYSNVYKVRIDPAHHKLTKVSKTFVILKPPLLFL